MPKQSMGEFMATLRKANGFTQQEVSDKLNISNRTLSSWETDRTLPDVLLLPAIADLYGVTVDELLHGERSNNEERIEKISEDSLKSINKNRFGSFVAQSSLMLGIALTCAAVFVLACILSLWTSAPAWLDLTLLTLGAVGLCACIAVVAYQYNKTKLSVGAVSSEDLTDEQKSFVLALHCKLENFILFCALPFAAFALITTIVFLADNPQNGQVFYFTINVRYGYVLIMCLNAALAIALAAAYAILKAVAANKYCIEEQQPLVKYNSNLARKLAAFGSIPIATVLLVNIVLALVFPNGCKILYKDDNYDSFRHQIQSFKVEESEYFGIFLDIPDSKPQNGDTIPQYWGEAGPGVFVQRLEAVGNPTWRGSVGYWHITYDGKSYDLDVYECDGKYITNGHYRFENTQDLVGNNRGEMRIVKRSGKYCFMQDISATLTYVAVFTFTVTIVATLAVCVTIYITKKKKLKYK